MSDQSIEKRTVRGLITLNFHLHRKAICIRGKQRGVNFLGTPGFFPVSDTKIFALVEDPQAGFFIGSKKDGGQKNVSTSESEIILRLDKISNSLPGERGKF